MPVLSSESFESGPWKQEDSLRPFNKAGEFVFAQDDQGEVRLLAARAAGVTLFSGGLALAIQMISTVVLARLIAPAEFGLLAMVASVSTLLMNFGGNGFTEAVIQRKEIDHKIASNLFWVNLASGLFLTILFASASSLLARFYGNPQVAEVAVAMSSTIFLSSVSVLHLALLRRAMRFSVVSRNEILARALSVLVSILLAWGGWRHWALVAGSVTVPLAISVGAWLACRWVPGRPRYVAGTGAMVWFALSTYARFSLNYATRNGDNLLVGWRFNAQALGFYKRAYDLFALSTSALITPVTLVFVSALSRLKPETSEYRRYLLDTLEMVALIGMGLGAVLTLTGKDLIRLLLGPHWAPAGQIFVFFGPGIGVMMLYYVNGWIHLSIGRPDRWLRWGIIELVVTGLLFSLGLQYGPAGIAMAWSASFWLLTLPGIWYAGRPIQLGFYPVVAVVWKYALASLLSAAATLGVVTNIPSLSAASGASGAGIRIGVISLVMATFYVVAVVVVQGGWSPVIRLISLVRDMMPLGVKSRPVANVAEASTPGPGDFNSDRRFDAAPNAAECPLVSILIPAYNAQEWISDTLRSAISQTWPHKEIIVVDDGSTDQTLAIAKEFESEGIRVVTQPNQGAAAARNFAFSLSHGDYIQWLDADDLLHPKKIACQMEAAQRSQSKRILFSAAFGRFMYRHYRAAFTPTALWSDLSPDEWLLRKMEKNIYMQTATWLVSRELTEAAGPWDTRLLADDDGEYFCRVIAASEAVKFIPEAKVYYRTPWFTSLGYVGQSAPKLDAHWLSMRLHVGYLRTLDNTERGREACLTYLQNNLSYFYPQRADILGEMTEMASTLGGRLCPPQLKRKYAYLKPFFGWTLIKRLQGVLPQVRWTVHRYWDKLLFQIDSQSAAMKNRGSDKEGALEATDPLQFSSTTRET